MEILLPRMKYTYEIVDTHGGPLLLEHAPGACSRSKIPRVLALKVCGLQINTKEGYVVSLVVLLTLAPQL